MTLAWVPAKEANQASASTSAIVTPLYMSTDREQLLTTILLPCRGDAPTWVLAGVAAFLTNLD